ncbi:uncharacterized protein si:ch211-133n4.6 isoform X2 [Takifugu flavidus]|uniref:uncharacterized protein si:ch211-133n4.6 isoform X2 n=1 Tax=Takifugu flavidus TaxID=433684 RepID=UPI0025449816|nr:uncharacterized protein si:ch211-133n4.6 isoform X2 [Takifugu flavidus]
MLTRKVLLFSLLILLVQADLDSNDTGIQAIATDQGSSDEAPTGSMNVLSPDQLESVKMVSPEQPDQSQFNGRPSGSSSSETTDTAAAGQVTAAEPSAAAVNSVEEEEEDDNSDSEENGRKSFRSAKPQRALPHQSTAHITQSTAHIVQSPAHLPPIPAVPSQPVVPNPKAMVRTRTSKKRSRTSRRQI